ncbi:protein RRP6-like 3 isoform X2 [Corylus avellana]|uniref:protein RRP6-like 3 isoform X2 n=1 Tax=Corylus avellana TaxID=13451 RepID=UPI00286A0D1C|nr:protein RRP6-like 3 isoform X2 [Corylus avellana]
MESRWKMRVIAITIGTVMALSIVYSAHLRRRRRKQKRSRSSCYLQADQTKPQQAFKRVLADNSYSPFKHLKLNESENALNSHPYEAEISALLENPQLEFSFLNGSTDSKMSEEYTWIETESQLKELLGVLSKERVFAVDTEQHSLRSFLGFTSLIQISTQKEDYLVDSIALHDSMGVLRTVFADPSICKVFHGADNDVLWLQRDFHIYVVNLFDTAKACEVLSKPQKSLAYLLETYCGVYTNKLLQREDWRQRPLSKEMVQYARMDAHYLLYIANCLIAELQQQDTEISCPDDKFNFVLEASRRSNMICLQLYTKEVEAFPGESAASSLSSRHLNSQGGVSSISCKTQFQDLVRRLCAWRDLMARVHDESLRYVLSDQAIVTLADRAPMTSAEIFSTITQADLSVELSFNSFLLSPSPVVCSHLNDVCSLLQDKIGNFNDLFPMILQKCLGPGGSCPFSVLNYALLVNCNLKVTVASKQNGERSSKQAARKSSRDLFVQKFSCKSPVYHNCRIYANDGRLLCYCDRRKLEWYLLRDLAKLVDENPPAIMLLFEPKGRPEDEDNDFYIQSKKNICVGCGEGNHYLRYRIIPSCYRIHFPEHLKSHRSHDIVLLCVDCHEVAHAAAERYKKQVAAEFGIPLFVSKVVDSKQAQVLSGSSESATNLEEAGVSPLQLRTAAMALLRHGPRMPSKRREELKQIVMSYYGGREITEVDLEMALLVGMSPHERRRLEKKKGLSFKQSILPNVEQENNIGCMETSSIVDASELSALDGSHNTEVKACCRKEDRETDADVGDSSICADSGIDGEISSTKGNANSDEYGVSDTKGVNVVNSEDNCESRSPSDGTVDLYHTKHDETARHKHNSKLSLLGHGPHGKQVVDHLQKEYGDDGIRQFCQRWRQVFVEAVHPRFLPAGWDVMHSGRRDFGEFSVYNPAKKPSATGKD